MNDEFNNETSGQNTMDKIKEWAQENIRIIVSILIVLLIASSIYSYSKRGEESVEVAERGSDIEKILEDLSSSETEEGDITESAAADETGSAEVAGTEDTETVPETGMPAEAPEAPVTQKQPVAEAQETENSFIESAQAGDGTTHLARRALAHYLEKNPDSSLTNEHKIYIEDYLRKKVGFQGRVHVGTSVEFSKSLIQEAISASKNLNDAQLKNLQKYSANVQF
ncbi:MAG: hypothetical protein PHH24_01480 [Candidatus Moranbacteria bacterium]|jgi:hypothetical protein|nr:hypothetical protein [Candidatus Moranbacteria bacterium]MDX9855483.1 hypothetical protein [Candidatus Moranbacteria bacterium]